MSKVVEVRWADSVGGVIVNVSVVPLYTVRVQLEDAGTVWGRRSWMSEVAVLHPGDHIRFGEFGRRGAERVGSPWFMVTFRTEIDGCIRFIELPLV